jgi:hypothetical protein
MKSHPADQISMVCANFANREAFEPVLTDWIQFLGARPGEIVVVDGGSDEATHDMYWSLFKRKVIDKLQVIRKEHPENHKDLCYYQEHAAGAIATKPYVLFWKGDTLPYRKGHDEWLAQAIDFLEREDTFAVGGSFNIPSKHHDAPWPGWYFSDKCSLNFSLMKRVSFMKAIEEYAGEYVTSGFRGENPGAPTNQERYLCEVAFERYIERHGKFTLTKIEDPTWTVFHTNAAGKKLNRVREDYLARKNIERFMNHGRVVKLHGGCYYGMKRDYMKEFRCAVGKSAIGPAWRALKRTISHVRGIFDTPKRAMQ